MSSLGHTLRLETTGRKSGKPHQVIVRYVTSDRNIIIFPEKTGEQDWVKNLKAGSQVRMFYNEKLLLGTGEVKEISGLQDPILSIFARKYGSALVKRVYWGQHIYVQISVSKSVGTLDYSEIVYGDLEAAFDAIAEDYDHHIFGNPINTWLRNVSIGRMTALFKPGQTILEVGCGSGTETLSLAARGIKVVATDISGKMLSVLSKKARASGVSDMITTIHCKPIELRERINALGLVKMDGAYSTYGAVNTEPNLDQMMENLSSVLKPNAPLVLGVWNRFCIYEILGYLLKANPTLAFARLRNPVPIGKSRFCVASNAFTVGTLNEHLKQHFKLENVFGVVILIPPSNLTKYLPRGRWLRILKKLDLYLGATFPANRLGDHFLAEYRKI